MSEPCEYRMADPAEFPELDRDFYDQSRGWFEARGFRFLGDRENVSLSRRDPSRRTFIRSIVSADGTILVYAYHIRTLTSGSTADTKTLGLETELSDGTFITTVSSTVQPVLTLRIPGIDSERYPATFSPEELLRRHHERLAGPLVHRPHLTATRIASMEECIQFQWRMQEVISKFAADWQRDKAEKEAYDRAVEERRAASPPPTETGGPISKRSAFRAFIAALKKQWRLTFPFVHRLTEPTGGLPMASTFYAGAAKPSGWHVFLWFQHSDKPWRVGQFTINVILSADQCSPLRGRDPPTEGLAAQSGEGSYRIGHVLIGKDKWWYLKDYPPDPLAPRLKAEWRPTTYADFDRLIREAVADVSRDVEAVFRILGLM